MNAALFVASRGGMQLKLDLFGCRTKANNYFLNLKE